MVVSGHRNRAVLLHFSGRLVDLACADNRLVESFGFSAGVDIVDRGDSEIAICEDSSKLDLCTKVRTPFRL